MIVLCLPWPPSANRYYRVVNGRSVLSAIARQYRSDIFDRFRMEQPLEGRLTVSLDAYPPDRRTRDLDNLLKQTLDALQHAGVFMDDGQIDQILIRRRERQSGGRMMVTITEE